MRRALPIALAAAALLAGASLAMAQEAGREPGRQEQREASSQGGSAGHRSVHVLSPEQRAELHRAIAGSDIRRADRVTFSLSVGTRIPERLRIYDVPQSIAGVLPQFRGFKYIVVQSELIIIDTRSRSPPSCRCDGAIGQSCGGGAACAATADSFHPVP